MCVCVCVCACVCERERERERESKSFAQYNLYSHAHHYDGMYRSVKVSSLEYSVYENETVHNIKSVQLLIPISSSNIECPISSSDAFNLHGHIEEGER